jgi:DNA polymerase-3 subunit epsilon
MIDSPPEPPSEPGHRPGPAWRRIFAGLWSRRLAQPSTTRRWVVCDVETSGLDAGRDALLAIGAVAVRDARLSPGDSFEARIRPERLADRENILIHRIGEQAQRTGQPAGQALAAFAAYVGDDPLVAFHADFDRGFLRRACRAAGVAMPPGRWLDLAELAPALLGGPTQGGLDDWLARCRIGVEERHDAISDALATAMLFQMLLAKVPAAQRHPAALARRCREARWLSRSA